MRKIMKKITDGAITYLFLIAITLGACSSPNDLDASGWTLKSYRSLEGNITGVLLQTEITMEFQGDQVSGVSGCNNYTGTYEASNGIIEFGTLASTSKMCVRPEGIMEQESAYLRALEMAAGYDIVGDTLELLDGAAELLMVFERASGG